MFKYSIYSHSTLLSTIGAFSLLIIFAEEKVEITNLQLNSLDLLFLGYFVKEKKYDEIYSFFYLERIGMNRNIKLTVQTFI